MDLGKVGLLNCDRGEDRGRAVKMTMVNKHAFSGRVPQMWKSAKRKALVITSITDRCDDTLCRTVRAGAGWRWSNKSLCLGGEHGDWSRVWKGLCLMHGGLQHVHSSSMGIQRAHIGCSRTVTRGNLAEGEEKARQLLILAGRVRNSGLWRARDVKGNVHLSCLLDLPPRGPPVVGRHIERSRRLCRGR